MENTNLNKNKYENGKIYMITDNAYTEKYIGSTTVGLSSRIAQHRRNYKRYKDGKYHFITIFDLFDKYDINNCKIELIEEAPCDTKEQLRKIEGQHIRNENCINKRIEGRTDKEYYEEYKIKLLEDKKEYYKNNINRIKARKKAYYENNKEKDNARSREYREKHKDELNEKNRIYQKENREKLLEKRREYVKNNYEKIRAKVACSYCNNLVCKDKILRHQRSKYCQEFQNKSSSSEN
jgi:hypothetical protein